MVGFTLLLTVQIEMLLPPDLDTRRSDNAVLMLGHCRRRWANLKPAVVHRLGLAARGVAINPLSPYNVLKHNFTSMKTALISLRQRV